MPRSKLHRSVTIRIPITLFTYLKTRKSQHPWPSVTRQITAMVEAHRSTHSLPHAHRTKR